MLSTHRRAEAVSHAASIVAVTLTVIMVSAGMVAESNPVARALIHTAGLGTWALATPLLVAGLFALLRRWQVTTRAIWCIPTLLAADALGNLSAVAVIGLPETVHVSRYAPVVVGLVVVAGLCYTRPTTALRQAPRAIRHAAPRPRRSHARQAAVLLILTALLVSGATSHLGSGSGAVGEVSAASTQLQHTEIWNVSQSYPNFVEYYPENGWIVSLGSSNGPVIRGTGGGEIASNQTFVAQNTAPYGDSLIATSTNERVIEGFS